jgi:curved DNA binding protein
MSESESEEEIADLSNPDVTTKYIEAARVVNAAMQKVLDACKPDVDVAELCKLGDDFIFEETQKLFNKKVKGKAVERGIAFPTCISRNNLCGHVSPLDGESHKLETGDVVKVDMAAHFDGFIAGTAHSVLLTEEEVTDGRADVMMAAYKAAEAVARCVAVGKTNTACTEVIAQVAAEYGVEPVQGVLSHQMKRHVIDGNQTIMNKETVEEKVAEFEFGLNEVYCVDIVMSTGPGKAKESEMRTTVFKRAVENSYMLKTQRARQFLSEVHSRFPTLCFSMRAFSDLQSARVGVSECMRHELLHEYPVLREKEGEFVAQMKFTVLLLPGGTKKITGMPLSQPNVKSTKEIKNEAVLEVLRQPMSNKKKKKSKSKEAKDDKDEGKD